MKWEKPKEVIELMTRKEILLALQKATKEKCHIRVRLLGGKTWLNKKVFLEQQENFIVVSYLSSTDPEPVVVFLETIRNVQLIPYDSEWVDIHKNTLATRILETKKWYKKNIKAKFIIENQLSLSDIKKKNDKIFLAKLRLQILNESLKFSKNPKKAAALLREITLLFD